MTNKDLVNELLEIYESDTEYDGLSFEKCSDYEANQEVDFELVKSILALKSLIPPNMFYLCLVFNALINKYIFKIGSTTNIINKMKEINSTYKSNGGVYLVAFTNLISQTFKRKFMEIPDLKPYSLGLKTFDVNKTVYDIFVGCSNEYFKLLNYKDILNIVW